VSVQDRQAVTSVTQGEDALSKARREVASAVQFLDVDRPVSAADGGRLRKILDISQLMNSTLDFEELLVYVVDMLIEFFEAERGFLILRKSGGELDFRIAHNLARESIPNPDQQVSHSIIEQVAGDGKSVLIENALEDERLKSKSSVLNLGLRSVMCSPLRSRNKLLGVLYVENRAVAGRFTRADMDLLEVFANQAGVAIENARLFRELRDTRDQLVLAEKLKALGEMAAGVAHDFNNLLSGILGRAQLLKKRVTDDNIRRELDAIEKSALDGETVIRRIQDFTRIRADENFTSVNVTELVEDAINMTRPRWKDAAEAAGLQIRFEKHLEPGLRVSGNASELREVLTNMVLNSLDAMPNGGQITFRSHAEGERVHLSVADSGKGMSEEVKRRVFDPFFTTKGFNGTGLGLSVAYGIITRHRGEIQVESKENAGTTFTIVLPRSTQQVEDKAPPQPPMAAKTASILVVDDSPEICEVVSRMLSSDGHRVVTVSSGQQGIEAARAAVFDILFTDLGMPGMSGWEVAKAIKGSSPKTAIVMMTGWGAQVDEETAKKGGVDYLMAKPMKMRPLLDLVAQVLERTK